MNREVFDDVFCVDCNGNRRQNLRGRNNYDGTLLYICTECGCENSVEDEYTKEMKQNVMR